MKTLLKYLSIALIAITAFSCIKEDGEIVPKGQIKVMVKVAEEISDPTDYSIKAKFFRAYSGQLVNVTLKVESITESGELVSASEMVEYGNWELQQVTLLSDKDAIYVGVGEDDERSSQITEESYLPLKTNVLEGETSTFSLELVEFDPEVDIDATTALYYDFSDGNKYDKVELNGWLTVDAIEGADRGWAYGEANGEKFAEAAVETGEESSYTSYMISPALDLDGTTNKRVWFKTAQTLWTNGTSFKVYLMDSPNPVTAKKVELTDATLANKSSVDGEWVESGEVDLSSYTGIQYIAFYYQADGGKDNSTTFRVNDFVYGDEDIPGAPEPDENTIAVFLKLADGTVGTVQGEITEVSINEDYGTVTYVVVKDANGDELMAYGVFKVSDEIYTVGQTLLLTGARDSYNGEDQLSFSEDSGHSIVVVDDGGGSSPEGSKDNPYTVETARTIQDESNAWVKGYVIG